MQVRITSMVPALTKTFNVEAGMYAIIMLHHSVHRHFALPGKTVNLMHSADPGGAEMTWQQQSRVLQYILLLTAGETALS